MRSSDASPLTSNGHRQHENASPAGAHTAATAEGTPIQHSGLAAAAPMAVITMVHTIDGDVACAAPHAEAIPPTPPPQPKGFFSRLFSRGNDNNNSSNNNNNNTTQQQHQQQQRWREGRGDAFGLDRKGRPTRSVSLFFVFFLQIILVAAAFVAILCVLIIRHKQDYDASVAESIRLRQTNAALLIQQPFLLRETSLAQIAFRMLKEQEKEKGMIVNANSTLTSMRPFFNAAMVSGATDTMLDTIYTLTETDEVEPSTGRLYWSAAAHVPRDKMVVVAMRHQATAAMGLTYPLPPAVPPMISGIPYPLDPDDFPRTVTQNRQSTHWHRAALAPNLGKTDYFFMSALSTPIVNDPIDGRVRSVVAVTCNVTEIRPIAVAARLTEDSITLLLDIRNDRFLMSTDRSFPQYNAAATASGDPQLWSISTFPHDRYRSLYYAAANRCNVTRDGCTFDSHTVGDEIISIVVVSTDTGILFHLLQITPRAFFYKRSEESRAIGIAVGVIAAALVVASCIAVYVWVQGPLSTVMGAMQLAAIMRNDEAADRAQETYASFLSEIAAIQRAFWQMNMRLTMARPFLPQHMLLTDDDEEGEGEGEGLDSDAEGDDEGDDDYYDDNDGTSTYYGAGGHAHRHRHYDTTDDDRSSAAVDRTHSFYHSPGSIAGGGVASQYRGRGAAAARGGGAKGQQQRRGVGPAASSTSGDTRSVTVSNYLGSTAAVVGHHHNSSSTHHHMGGGAHPPFPHPQGALGRRHAVAQYRRVGVLIINLIDFHAATVVASAASPFYNGGVAAAQNQHQSQQRYPNGRHFASGPPQLTSDGIVALHSRIARLVEAAAGAERGVVDSFQGDHFTVVFNAARACASVGRAGALCSLQIAAGGYAYSGHANGAALPNSPDSPAPAAGINAAVGHANAKDFPSKGHSPVLAKLLATPEIGTSPRLFSMGFASGRCLVSNMGTATMKRLCIVGPAFSEAAALERLARHVGHRCLLSSRSLDGVETVAYTLLVGKARLPHGALGGMGQAMPAAAGRGASAFTPQPQQLQHQQQQQYTGAYATVPEPPRDTLVPINGGVPVANNVHSTSHSAGQAQAPSPSPSAAVPYYPIRAVMEPLAVGATDEWLYEVGEGQANDPYAAANAAMWQYLTLPDAATPQQCADALRLTSSAVTAMVPNAQQQQPSGAAVVEADGQQQSPRVTRSPLVVAMEANANPNAVPSTTSPMHGPIVITAGLISRSSSDAAFGRSQGTPTNARRAMGAEGNDPLGGGVAGASATGQGAAVTATLSVGGNVGRTQSYRRDLSGGAIMRPEAATSAARTAEGAHPPNASSVGLSGSFSERPFVPFGKHQIAMAAAAEAVAAAAEAAAAKEALLLRTDSGLSSPAAGGGLLGATMALSEATTPALPSIVVAKGAPVPGEELPFFDTEKGAATNNNYGNTDKGEAAAPTPIPIPTLSQQLAQWAEARVERLRRSGAAGHVSYNLAGIATRAMMARSSSPTVVVTRRHN